MASLQTLEARVRVLEARLSEVEGGFSETIYQLRRESVWNRLAMNVVLGHLGLTAPSEADVDTVLDQT